MSVTKWEPFTDVFDDMADLRRQMRRVRRLFAGEFNLPFDVYETPEGVVVRADLPGVAPENVKVEYRPGTLTIHGMRRFAHPESATFLRRERGEGEFHCAVSVEAPIDDTKIRAVHEHGVVTVHLPKLPEAKSREIQVETSK